MSLNNVPRINGPQALTFGGVQATGIGYANPELFPTGLEVVLMVPGTVAPVGKFTIPPGLAIAVIGPPPAALELVQSTRAARDRLQPGMTLPPGM